MKSPTNYGSENEETTFIRRVAAPDRPNAGRRQKKRLILAGAGVTLVSASAAVGYAAFRSSGMDTATMPAQQQLSANLVAPDFVSTMGDGYYPEFDVLDQNEDGIVTYPEYMRGMRGVWESDKQDIVKADLPEVVKDNLFGQLNDKITSDIACIKKAMIPISTTKRTLTFSHDNIDSLYYMLDVFCFDTPIRIPQQYLDMFPSTTASNPSANNEWNPTIPTMPPMMIKLDTNQGQEQVTPLGPIENGQLHVQIDEPSGRTTQQYVPVEQTPEGPKMQIETSDGNTHELQLPVENEPNEGQRADEGWMEPIPMEPLMLETPNGQEQVTPLGPIENGQLHVQIDEPSGRTTQQYVPLHVQIDEPSGRTTQQYVPVEQTPEGPKMQIETSDGNTHELELPSSAVESIGETEETIQKKEFQQQLVVHFAEKFKTLQLDLADEESWTKNLIHRKKALDDCIAQAADKFGYSGDQSPDYETAVNWVKDECWKM
ncbi:Ankyrin repeat domain-containing protein 60 [Phytophthora boehmeriae]|uniref:Ankyrin repeat domain-containing protein 60 n=1 Tax=Phytophthora boehmeriae TaxID=109152 RepID=A0A8T1V4P1_9STRA|nr:Ankyrin repeat domain-containing protein 60 [Phytophthora boehmeriae]